ncbi:hypothetical protein BDP55DRAFT_721266 [Colletotrichum godetiae]|uniref:Uncharacterized protein n=1 Tax=Colletotrichum godetiae TaxID=1209918 RepID=A0AAJ0EQK1_9PEZI|nr:uncharacterized protein BDP55DRAFT_721266 [Colletotrichum godetiae]KAK1657664.1 hypothetical protein BDP55DRAFT_721266 [Colletotrichum godetiae]
MEPLVMAVFDPSTRKPRLVPIPIPQTTTGPIVASTVFSYTPTNRSVSSTVSLGDSIELKPPLPLIPASYRQSSCHDIGETTNKQEASPVLEDTRSVSSSKRVQQGNPSCPDPGADRVRGLSNRWKSGFEDKRNYGSSAKREGYRGIGFISWEMCKGLIVYGAPREMDVIAGHQSLPHRHWYRTLTR